MIQKQAYTTIQKQCKIIIICVCAHIISQCNYPIQLTSVYAFKSRRHTIASDFVKAISMTCILDFSKAFHKVLYIICINGSCKTQVLWHPSMACSILTSDHSHCHSSTNALAIYIICMIGVLSFAWNTEGLFLALLFSLCMYTK